MDDDVLYDFLLFVISAVSFLFLEPYTYIIMDILLQSSALASIVEVTKLYFSFMPVSLSRL